MASTLNIGDAPPDFRCVAVGGCYGEGKEVQSGDLAGRRLVLYFYPKDDTPGCTAQACDLRDHWAEIAASGAALFGVSADDASAHLGFIGKYSLPFPLLSDPERRMVQDYGVWVEKVRDGKTSMGIERTTFVIGPDGRIETILRSVAPAGHLDLLRAALA